MTILFVSLVIPAGLMLNGSLRFRFPRLAQIFAIETGYMAVAATAVFAITIDSPSLNKISGYGFFCFCVLQTTGFMIDSIRKGSTLGAVSTVFSSIAMILWGASASLHSVMASDGRFLMWGENAPPYIQAIYSLWAVQVIVEMRSLPKLTEASAHIVSVLVALFSGQFFFARLLTASQIILLDALLHYTDPAFLGKETLTVSETELARFRSFYRRFGAPLLFGLVTLLAGLSSYGSLQRLNII
ncbi:hypothetical protein [Roseibium sp. RKSG952]|uniref:hypothetical protein n=1 Tax=Roseibium sp. RKSG952 TaxID=2529384 RepID=UPI0012BC8DF1|nr:hypothetical protein [Roseibium sp. RKSG952]MTH95579.1 hypothetical protein [Roseibium sp. RKSG952]